jgi:hypothetical protein
MQRINNKNYYHTHINLITAVARNGAIDKWQ